MKNRFRSYYRPTEEEFRRLWEEGEFVPDANVLLNLYRYTPPTRDDLLGVLRALKARLWLPYQVGLEYHERRLSVICEQIDHVDKIIEILRSTRGQIESRLPKFKHPFIPRDEIIAGIDRLIEETVAQTAGGAAAYKKLLVSDPIGGAIAECFNGRVGDPYTAERLDALYKEGEERYGKKVPPGYEDLAKPAPDRYGDLVLWKQIVDRAGSEKHPIVFVTDDVKDDWWLNIQGERLGPRRELVEEIISQSGAPFWIYDPIRFVEQARAHKIGEVSEETVEEVRDVAEAIRSASEIDSALEPEEMERVFGALSRNEGYINLAILPSMTGISPIRCRDVVQALARQGLIDYRVLKTDEYVRLRTLADDDPGGESGG